jgi:hypothetical protein
MPNTLHWVWIRPEPRASWVPQEIGDQPRHAWWRRGAPSIAHPETAGRGCQPPGPVADRGPLTASPERPRPVRLLGLFRASMGASIGRLSRRPAHWSRGPTRGEAHQPRTSRLRQRRSARGVLCAGAAPTEAGFGTFTWRTIFARNSLLGVRYDSALYLANRAVRCPHGVRLNTGKGGKTGGPWRVDAPRERAADTPCAPTGGRYAC